MVLWIVFPNLLSTSGITMTLRHSSYNAFMPTMSKRMACGLNTVIRYLRPWYIYAGSTTALTSLLPLPLIRILQSNYQHWDSSLKRSSNDQLTHHPSFKQSTHKMGYGSSGGHAGSSRRTPSVISMHNSQSHPSSGTSNDIWKEPDADHSTPICRGISNWRHVT